jgi:hypothetical protein
MKFAIIIAQKDKKIATSNAKETNKNGKELLVTKDAIQLNTLLNALINAAVKTELLIDQI